MKKTFSLASFICALFLLINVNFSHAEVRVAQIFSDHMVLQRGINVPIWGTADPGEKITLNINGLVSTAVTGKDGNWKTYLPEFEAGGPYEMVVKSSNEVKFEDILFGDVWVASGQSNMAWRLENSNNGEEEVKNANLPEVRLFYVPRRVGKMPKDDLEGGQWDVCTPEAAKGFSAVAFFFGKELNKDINVPIGLINCNWGGTVAEAWTSSDMLQTLPDFKERVIELDEGPNWEDDIEANEQRGRDKNGIINNSFNGLEVGVHKVSYNSNDWPVVIAPDWDEKLDGVVWMRKVLEIPKEFKGQELRFDLGRISNNATIYFNEQKLGISGSPYFAEFTVPAKLVKAGKNVIAVRLLHRRGTPNFQGPEDRMKLFAPNGAVLESLSGPWKYKTGLEPEFPNIIGYQN